MIHTDICGPTRMIFSHDEKYFMFLIDDYIRMCLVSFFKYKDEEAPMVSSTGQISASPIGRSQGPFSPNPLGLGLVIGRGA